MKLYNGSAFKIENPKILTSGFYKDFGYGFYCTNIEKQAKRWAATRGKQHIVNVYSYVEDENLKILKFDNMTEEWLDFVSCCRTLKPVEKYDIIIGGIADDKVFNILDLYFDGLISKLEALDRLKYEKPNHQLCILNQAVIEKGLKFVDSIKLDL